MRHRLSFLVACLAIASLGVAGVLVATTHPVSANPEPRIEASPDASFSSVEAPPLEPATCSSCLTKDICTKDNQNCKCARGRGKCMPCSTGGFFCQLVQ